MSDSAPGPSSGLKRVKLSGWQYKQAAAKKMAKEKESLSKTPKLSSFFVKLSVDGTSTSKSDDETNELQGVVTDRNSSAIGESPSIDLTVQGQSSDIPNPSNQTEDEMLDVSTHILKAVIPVVSNDPAEWKLNKESIDYLIAHGIPQNKDADFTSSKRLYSGQARFCSLSLFSRIGINGEKRPRTWLVFSESKGSVFCGPCRLFGKSGILAIEGFNDWKNASTRLSEHENSLNHRSSCVDLMERKNSAARIDGALIHQAEEEIEYWNKLLRRVVAVIKSLASRGLPFRGTDERFGSHHSGNYIMTLELLAEFDPFLADHIKRFANKGKGSTSYLSFATCDEFINIMAEKLKIEIVTEVKAAKYYSISVDSTPDVSHVDQLSFIVRYVSATGTPVERFLAFIPNCGHKSEELAQCVLNTLAELGLEIGNCRGQSYDNANNMAGAYSGLQARIKEINPLAMFVPCSGHSLNLVGSCAAECCPLAVRLFTDIQNLYNFFSASTHRWSILYSHLKSGSTVLKSLSATRWSARHDACRSLCTSWSECMAALNVLADDEKEKPTTRAEASGIMKRLDRLDICIIALVWHDILARFHGVSKLLQSVDIELGNVVDAYYSLIAYVNLMRENFDTFEEKAMKLCGKNSYPTDEKRRKPIRETNPDSSISRDCRDVIRVDTFYVIIDRLSSELQRRCRAYENLNEKFDFLTKLTSLEVSIMSEKARQLQNSYPDDLEETFEQECIHLALHLKSTGITKTSARFLYKLLHDKFLSDVYPNVDVALRIFLCTPAANTSAERSFSVLKRVKNYLRSNLTSAKLNALSLLYIETEYMRKIDFDEIIKSFAEKKVRRKQVTQLIP